MYGKSNIKLQFVFLYNTKHNIQCNVYEEVITAYIINLVQQIDWPVPMAARSKAWVCGCSSAGITGSNPAGSMDVCLLWVLGVVR